MFKHNGDLFRYLIYLRKPPNMYYNIIVSSPLLHTLVLFLSENGKEIILAPPFLRLLSELMIGTCLSRPRKHSLCFPKQAFAFTFFAKRIAQLIGKNKG